VVVIGGGMTAVDAAVQAKLLGAENVTIAYRRGREDMNASEWEQELATAKGVTILPQGKIPSRPSSLNTPSRAKAVCAAPVKS